MSLRPTARYSQMTHPSPFPIRTNMGCHLPRPNNDTAFSNFPFTLRYCSAGVQMKNELSSSLSGIFPLLVYGLRQKYDKLIMISWFFSWHRNIKTEPRVNQRITTSLNFAAALWSLLGSCNSLFWFNGPQIYHMAEREPLSSAWSPAAHICFHETSSDKSSLCSLELNDKLATSAEEG